MGLVSALKARDGRGLGSSLAFRIAAGGLLISALFMVGLGGTGYYVLRSEIERDKINTLRQSATIAADEVSARLHALAQALTDLAANKIVASALTDNAGRDAYLLPFLDSFRSVGGVGSVVALTDFEGKVLVTAASPRVKRAMEPLAAKAIARSRPQVRILGDDGRDFLALAAPVMVVRTGTVEGALVALVPVDDLLPRRWMERNWPFHGRLVRRAEDGSSVGIGPPFGAHGANGNGNSGRVVEAVVAIDTGGSLAALGLGVSVSADLELLHAPLDRLVRLLAALGL